MTKAVGGTKYTKLQPRPVASDSPKSLVLTRRKDVSAGQILAESIVLPLARHAAAGDMFARQLFGSEQLNINDGVAVLAEACDRARDGNLTTQRDMLVAQAITLDGIFTEMARRSALNVSGYLDAAERFMRLALKAQAQSRASIETLERLARGGEQVVRHIHVDNRGGQAIVAETINTTNAGNSENDKQCRTTGNSGVSTPLLSADATGDRVQVPGSVRETSLQDARGDQ